MATSTFAPERGKLTKTFFFEAPAGKYLASNCGFPPIFAEVIASSVLAKFAQWKKITKVAADSRLCYIYESREQYEIAQKALIDRLVHEGRAIPDNAVL
jgi:hypothetical protein